MAPFVVFRQTRALMIWYVTARSAPEAIERVFPTRPDNLARLAGVGGMETPALEACVPPDHVWAKPIRRVPPSVESISGGRSW